MSCIPINDFSLISLCDATKAGKLYSIVPDTGAGDFDVTRASTATYLGSDGLLKTAVNDEPRIEFNPDGSYKGLLVEPAATNLLTNSQDFTAAAGWNQTGVPGAITATANFGIAPDGTNTSTRIVFASASQIWRKTVTGLTGNAVFSLWIKGAPGETIVITCGQTADVLITLDGEWNRVNTDGTAAINNNIFINTFGATARDIEVWGGQVELGTVATSYIPTVASTVTRAADVISRTGASGLIGQTEGTLYAEVDISNPDKSIIRTILGIGDGSAANRFSIRRDTNGRIIVICVVNSSTIGFIQTGNDQLGFFKIAVAYAANDLVMYINGNQIGTTTIPSVPACSRIDVGKVEGTGASNFFNDHIKAAALLPTRLSNAQLEALTS